MGTGSENGSGVPLPSSSGTPGIDQSSPKQGHPATPATRGLRRNRVEAGPPRPPAGGYLCVIDALARFGWGRSAGGADAVNSASGRQIDPSHALDVVVGFRVEADRPQAPRRAEAGPPRLRHPVSVSGCWQSSQAKEWSRATASACGSMDYGSRRPAEAVPGARTTRKRRHCGAHGHCLPVAEGGRGRNERYAPRPSSSGTSTRERRGIPSKQGHPASARW